MPPQLDDVSLDLLLRLLSKVSGLALLFLLQASKFNYAFFLV